jgi:DNA-directed RNA polymerase subunit beta'
LIEKGQLILEEMLEKIAKSGIDEVKIRSVLTCDTEFGICASCYGRDLARGTRVNIGEAVGVMAAQSIGEPGTQLTMRTFHIGGAAQHGSEQSTLDCAHAGKVIIKNNKIVKNSSGHNVVLSRNLEVVIMDENNRERATHRILYGSRIHVNDGDVVQPGARIAEWDPYTIPIVAEADGIVHFVDLIEGQSVREVMDESTGITSRVIIDWNQQARSQDLHPMLSLRDKDGKPVKLSNGIEARYFLPVDAIVSASNTTEIRAGDIMARIPRETMKTRDITGGLPRVSELFEARHPKDCAIIAEFDGRIEFGKDYKAKRRILVMPEDNNSTPIEYLVPKGRHILVHEGDYVKKGDMLVDGNPVPHDILRIQGVEALASYLVNEIQQVYRLQGVPINDKHIEVIVRQMLQKSEILDAGDTNLILGEHVDRTTIDRVNKLMEAENKRPARAIPVLQGITKASLHTKSFISAASFQETTRVLTEAAVAGKIDTLQGLKENVIVGRLIPAGTGSVVNALRRLARMKDQNLLNGEKEKVA